MKGWCLDMTHQTKRDTAICSTTIELYISAFVFALFRRLGHSEVNVATNMCGGTATKKV